MLTKKIRSAIAIIGVIILGLTASLSQAGPILIINGSSGTSEPNTTTMITNNLEALHIAAGNTVTIFDGVPVDLSPFSQVWDIRFSNNLAITESQESQFLSYLQSGGGMFVMGENGGFMTRNNSVLGLIDAAGGGLLSYTGSSSAQTVNAPFGGPNPVTSVNFAAPGGVGGPGIGQCITEDDSGRCAGVAFGLGTLNNASNGALTAIFDVNFMQGSRGVDQQNLLKNLIGFVGEAVDPPNPNPVPEPSILVLFVIGLLSLSFRFRRFS